MIKLLIRGIADAIRLQFHPGISYNKIQRLYALPGTCTNAEGISFSFSVLKLLRRCIYHHIYFDDALVEQVIAGRSEEFTHLNKNFLRLWNKNMS